MRFSILISLLFTVAWSDRASGSNCAQLSNCSECIQSSLKCKWCTQLGFIGSRCHSNEANSSCKVFYNPEGELSIDKNEAFSDIIQVSPQRVNLTLRPGQPQRFNLTIKPALNFPLDVYFLMDHSKTMKNEIKDLRNQIISIVPNMRKISKDSRIGFGAFVDKRSEPFVRPESDLRPFKCKLCRPGTYSFTHKVSLQNFTFTDTNRGTQSELFVKLVVSEISSTFDNPESGTDALLQTVVCTDLVGWRPFPARHLLMYITDDDLHFGYDGKIAGIVTPHDGKCHMEGRNDNDRLEEQLRGQYDYTAAERLDYPSISMLNSKLVEKEINVIFGISALDGNSDGEIFNKYQNLSSQIPNTFVQPINKNRLEFFEALDEAYKTISSRIELEAALPSTLQGLRVRYFVNCSGEWVESSKCSNIAEETTFEVEITALQCTPELKKGQTFSISTGLYGSMEVHVSTICDCECDSMLETNSDNCSNHGSLVCGKCFCNEQRFGDKCQCGVSGNETSSTQCRAINGKVCSGPVAGECICGVCACNTNVGGNPGHYYFGDNCECNNFQCDKDDKGRFCSGNGVCGCNGLCTCDLAPSGRPYTGENCNCYPDDDTCRATPDGEICSGHGSCECGSCSCQKGFGGKHCEICINATICGDDTCSTHEECIKCAIEIKDQKVVQREKLSEDCQKHCSNKTIILGIVTKEMKEGKSLLLCTVNLASGCSGVLYLAVKGKNTLYVDKSISCQNIVPIYVIVAPIIAGLLLFALICLILVKLYLTFLDYREYKSFKKEIKETKFGEFESPIYRAAWQTFYCPMFPGNLERGLIGSVPREQTADITDESIRHSLPSLRGESPKPSPLLTKRMPVSKSVPMLCDEPKPEPRQKEVKPHPLAKSQQKSGENDVDSPESNDVKYLDNLIESLSTDDLH